MAEELQDQPKSYFPVPPQFYQHFTDVNVKALKIPTATNPNVASRLMELPAELRYLIPPAEPVDGKWKNFGELHELYPALPSLEDQGIARLYPTTDEAPSTSLFQNVPLYLHQISRSIIANFLELLGILAVDPTQGDQKVKALRDLFINGEHLINLYRPHEARESLILMMEDELENKKEVTRQVDAAKSRLYATLGSLPREHTKLVGRDSFGEELGHVDVGAMETIGELPAEVALKHATLWAALSELRQ